MTHHSRAATSAPRWIIRTSALPGEIRAAGLPDERGQGWSEPRDGAIGRWLEVVLRWTAAREDGAAG